MVVTPLISAHLGCGGRQISVSLVYIARSRSSREPPAPQKRKKGRERVREGGGGGGRKEKKKDEYNNTMMFLPGASRKTEMVLPDLWPYHPAQEM